MRLNETQIAHIRRHWHGNDSFIGFPDAERDSNTSHWMDQLLVRPSWFASATRPQSSIIVGRKGVGKSAVRIAATTELAGGQDTLVINASADELVARHAVRLKEASDRGFGAVADWCQVFAELVVRHVAQQLGGSLITNDDEEHIRKWAVLEGVSERDFGERLSSSIASLVPWAKNLLSERGAPAAQRDRFARIAQCKKFSLYIDDFDNIQENKSLNNTRLIRDAVEAADRVTNQNSSASVHLLMRQDLWLRLRPGWHYADKAAGIVQLNWTQDDLLKWAARRLVRASSEALGIDPSKLVDVTNDDLWSIFFPEKIVLRNDKESAGLHYVLRRTMYTPRGLGRFMGLIVTRARQYPANLRDVEDAEEEFSTDQLEFLKTEFGGLCDGLDICLQSFTGKTNELQAQDLYKHLRGLIGNGQVKLVPGASDGSDEYALAHFLYRIGFLEVRYQEDERFEVRDAMRYPDQWKSARRDDSVKWAVRSAFFCALRSHR